MSVQSTVTDWIGRLKQGRESAAEKLWDHYLQQLTRLASRRLNTASKAVSDEEDVVIDACEACFRALKDGRYPDVHDREDLWKLLAITAERKTIDQIRRNSKGVDSIRKDITVRNSEGELTNGIQTLPGSEPTPEFAAIFSETVQEQLCMLNKPMEKQVALMKMHGYTNCEIAERIDRSIPTVERNLRIIRMAWLNEPAKID